MCTGNTVIHDTYIHTCEFMCIRRYHTGTFTWTHVRLIVHTCTTDGLRVCTHDIHNTYVIVHVPHYTYLVPSTHTYNTYIRYIPVVHVQYTHKPP